METDLRTFVKDRLPKLAEKYVQETEAELARGDEDFVEGYEYQRTDGEWAKELMAWIMYREKVN